MTPTYFEFQMDETYHREFHREWVAAQGAGWRASRRLAVGFTLGSLVLIGTGWSDGLTPLMWAAFALLAIAALIIVDLVKRHNAWLANCRTFPWYGKTLRVEVRDGDLVQVQEQPGLLGVTRTGPLVITPKGYLVKYRGSIPHTDRAVSTTEASVYLPHVALAPPLTREEFLACLDPQLIGY